MYEITVEKRDGSRVPGKTYAADRLTLREKTDAILAVMPDAIVCAWNERTEREERWSA